jgi:hypothetical protein
MMQTTTLPPPPRPLTPAASRAAWREAEVRSLLLVAAGVIVVILAVGVRQIIHGISDRLLFRNGVLVDATIENIDGANRNVDRSVQRRLKLSFTLPGETEKRNIEGFSTPMPGVFSRFDKIPIRIDPKDLDNWTERAEPVPWVQSLIVPIILTPPALLLFAVAALKRRSFTSIFRDGSTFTGNVREVHRSALVPGQRVVKTVIAGGEGRVLTVTMPAALAPSDKGATIEILAHDAAATRAVAAAAYR